LRSFVVRAEKPEQLVETQQQLAVDPPDIGSFLWGMVAGGIVVVVIEGVVLYFTWPIFLGFIKGLVGAEAVKAVL